MRRIIQVGVGGMGVPWTNVVAASKRWEAAAYVDVNEKNLMDAAARHSMPKSRCFTSLTEALSSVEADALLDVTPQQFRRKVCTTALRRGLHVLSEKPLADSIRNAVAIIETAAKEKRVFMVAQNYRYQVGAQTVKDFLNSGKLGTLGYVGVAFHKGPHFGGFREQMAYPLVLDMSIHHFDLMRMFLEKDVRTVQASSINAPWNWNKGDATVMAQLEFAGGVVVNYFGSWVSQGAETSWNGDWRFEGCNGVLLWNSEGVFFSQKPDEKIPVPLVPFPIEHQAYLLEAFADALDSGKEPETSGRKNLNSLATTYAVVKAAKQRRRVQVAELLK